MSQHPQEQEDPYSTDAWMRNEVKLRSTPPDYLTNIEDDICEFPPEYPVYYFFYGTLTTPTTLQRIFDLPKAPKMRKAKLIGYGLAKWDDYPALIDGETGQQSPGYAHFVQNEEEAQKLANYETKA
jgi:hypothetical protein